VGGAAVDGAAAGCTGVVGAAEVAGATVVAASVLPATDVSLGWFGGGAVARADRASVALTPASSGPQLTSIAVTPISRTAPALLML
jgi:hypothetical protein